MVRTSARRDKSIVVCAINIGIKVSPKSPSSPPSHAYKQARGSVDIMERQTGGLLCASSRSADWRTVESPTLVPVQPLDSITGSKYHHDSHPAAPGRARTHPRAAGAVIILKVPFPRIRTGRILLFGGPNCQEPHPNGFYLRFVPIFGFTVFAWLLNRVIDLLSYCMGEPIRHDSRYQ